MIPKLFPANATSFTTNGLGALRDAKKCQVTEERNGIYELSMTYYTAGQHYKEIQNECIIVALPYPGATPQAFYIENIVDNLDGTVEILAKHISYRASYVPITPFSATGIQAAVAGLKSHELEVSPFSLWTDIVNETTKYQQTTLKSLRACLGGSEDSLLDAYSSKGTGEYEWDNFNIKFHFHRGTDKGYSIRYRRNLSDLSKEVDTTDVATGCVAYWEDYETGISYYGDVQHSTIYDTYPVKKTVIVDASENFESAPTREQLNAFALNYVNELVNPKETTEIDFYDENNDVRLCDTIGVHYEIMNGNEVLKTIDYKAKVVKTVFDVLLERYTKITIGDNASDLASTLDKKNEEAVVAAVQAVDNRMVSVYQYVDEEVGQATTAISTLSGATVSNLSDIVTYYYVSDSQNYPDKYDPEWIGNTEFTDFIEEHGALEEGQNLFVMYEYVYDIGFNRRTDPIIIQNGDDLTSISTEYYVSSSTSEPTGSTWSSSKLFTPGYYTWVREHCIYEDETEVYSEPRVVVSVGDINNVTSTQQTQINQNTEAISLSVTTEDVQKIVYENNRVNYSPFYSHDIEDVNDGYFGWAEVEAGPMEDPIETEVWKWIPGEYHPNGYWYVEPENCLPIDDGYAIIELDGSEGPAVSHVVVNMDERIIADNLTLMLEVDQIEFEEESESNKVTFTTDLSYDLDPEDTQHDTTIYANYAIRQQSERSINITTDGTHRITITKVNPNENNKMALVVLSFSVASGIHAYLKARLSAFNLNYADDYYPYNDAYVPITEEFNIVNNLISTLSSSLNITNQGINAQVSRVNTLEQKVDDTISDATQTITRAYENLVNTTATGIYNTISELTDVVTAQGVDKYERYITIDQTIDGIIIGKSESDIRGQFDNDSLDFIDQNNNTIAWLAAEDGLGANFLSVGSGTNRGLRWNIIVSADGNSLRFARHE